VACRRIGVLSVGVYVALGVFIWVAFLESGVHPTVAGVLLGLLTPAQPVVGPADESVSPLQHLEQGLHPWVAFVVMPVFALANAGVTLSPASVGEPVAFALAIALAGGKPVGIMFLCLIAVRLRVTDLPAGVTWPMLVGGACLAGIGFTMALFLNTLAFPVDQYAVLESAGKVGTLAGSMVSAVIGVVILTRALAR
jgi:NhaA family Na+:H+ antiporter